MRAFGGFLVIIAAVVSMDGGPAWADWNQQAKLVADDASSYDYLGCSVSISGDYALAGAYGDNASRGAAYVFFRDAPTPTWTQQAKLTASDGGVNDYFGDAVSISGDYCVAGAGFDDDKGQDSGSVYVFHRTGTSWAQEAKLTASDGGAGDYFGSSVSISGDYVVVGARQEDDNGSASGSAYVFRRDGATATWTQQAKLVAADGASGDWFGHSVSVRGDMLVVGAVYDGDSGSSSGSAYVFHLDGATSTWTEQAKLAAADGAAGDCFGHAVSISGDAVVVGANSDDDNGLDSGSAYVFGRDGATGTWTQQGKLTAADGAGSDSFGHAVGISGDGIVVGAYGNDDDGSSSGSAYVFHLDGASGTWTQQAKLTADDGSAGDSLGWRVDIDGGSAIAGAYLEGDGGAGAAYVFTPEPATLALLAAGTCLLLARRRRKR